MSGLILRVRPLRFGFRAVDPIFFPLGQAANIFRGAFGEILRRTAPAPAYARMFEPRSEEGPSGFADLPRPFVLRAAWLDGRQFGAGEAFTLDVNVFDPDIPALDDFRTAFERLCEEGLGRNRPRVELLEARELPGVEINLSAPRKPASKIRLTFLTPTELKIGGAILREPRFDAVFKRARDRVTGLIGLYQNESAANELDFRGLGQRAEAVRMTASGVQQIEHKRRSSRTGQVHSLGGFTGEAEYEGELAEFLPYLEAAWWTGIGRLTVWGNGLFTTNYVK
jgi:hypothetical protein